MKKSTFTCGCCGNRFQAHKKEQRKFDQDKGFGICPECVDKEEKKNEEGWNLLRDRVANAFKDEKNKLKFLALEKEVQRGMMLKMMEDGIIYNAGRRLK